MSRQQPKILSFEEPQENNHCLLRSILRENVPQATFQAGHDLLKVSQRDALLALFQTMERRGRQADFPGEFGKSQAAAFPAKEGAELFFERVTHRGILANRSFHLWNKSLDRLAWGGRLRTLTKQANFDEKTKQR